MFDVVREYVARQRSRRRVAIACFTDGARELAMPNAEFEVRMSEKEVDATGADAVEFFFTASLGEERRPLGQIARGGEISRLLRRIKAQASGLACVPSLIVR